MSIEQKINQKLNKYPGIKKGIKRIYQRSMYTISPKIKSEGNIVRVSPDDPKHEYFFGYYDKCPEDATGRYVLCLKADDTWSDPAPAAAAEILLIDTSKPENDSERVKVIASTRTWNVQQGCMMQWLGPEYDHEIIYNDFRDGSFCSVILDVFSGAERVLAAPVYSVSADGSFALTLDFARLHRLRPGYGYSNILEGTRNEKLPDATAVWRLDLRINTLEPLLRYTDFSSFEPRPEMKQAEHKVNHIMLSPNGKRFMVLHRWFDGQRKYTRLVTVNTDGSEMYNLSDDDMVSHCYWKDDETIIAFENKKGQGAGYYLMHDKTQRFERLWPEMTADGHPSCSPDGQLVVTDTYPNRSRIASVKVMRGNLVETVAKVFAPFRYDNDTRCDLHPRWSRDGKKVYIDSVFEGRRGLYGIQIIQDTKLLETPLVSCIIPTYKRSDMLPRAIESVLNQTYKNIEIVIVDDNEPDDEYSINTRNRIAEYLDNPGIRFVQQKKHCNGAVARNVGIQQAKGEYIAFLDDDDEWLPEKIEKQLSLLQRDHSLSGATTLSFIQKGDTTLRVSKAYSCDNLQLKVLTREVSIYMPTFISRRDALISMGCFDPSLLRHQDLQLFTAYLEHNNIGLVPEPLTVIHTDSAINRPSPQKLILAKKAYFESVHKELLKYNRHTRGRITGAHRFEIVFASLKAHDYADALKYLLKIGVNPSVYMDVMKRYMNRKK